MKSVNLNLANMVHLRMNYNLNTLDDTMAIHYKIFNNKFHIIF